MPTLYMMVGVPGSGKSTWIEQQGFNPQNTVIVSTDNFIDAEARSLGKTYGEVFKSAIKRATQAMQADLDHAIRDRMNVVWDQTNLTAKVRKGKLLQIPRSYEKVAVYFRTPDPNELKIRLDSRPGKTIPSNIVLGMISQLEMPSAEEGFDRVVVV